MENRQPAVRISLRSVFRSSLRWQLWLLLFCTIFMILLTSTALTSQIMNRYLHSTVLSSSEQLVYQGGENLLSYLDDIENASLVPYADSTFYNLLASSNTRPYEIDSYIKLTLNAIASSDSSIRKVHLYADGTRTSYLINHSSVDRTTAAKPKPEKDLFFEPLHVSHNYGVSSVKPDNLAVNVLTLHRTLYQIPEYRYIGHIDIDLDTSYLSSVMEKLVNGREESIFLANEDGEMIYALEDQAEGDFAGWLEQIPAPSDTGTIMPCGDGTPILIYRRIHLTSGSLLLVKAIPPGLLTAGASTLIRLNWIAALLCLLAASVGMASICRRFTSPLQYLIRHMVRIERGEKPERIASSRMDEIGVLFRRFQSMLDHIDELTQQRYQLELSNKTHQLLALQAQLNPHFINNTIQSIGACALQAGSQEIYQQLSDFGSMMRYCMDFESTLVPLEQELAYVDHYLCFQKARFPGRFVYSIHAAPELREVQIPKMLIQPVVENSFKHGHMQNRPNGFILVVAEYDKDSLVLTVADNGCGAEEEALQALRCRMEQEDSGRGVSDHIGLLNLAARIRLYYGQRALLTFGNRPRGGFEVTIRLPRSEVSRESTDC